MDHKHLYLESCQNPTSLNATMLDDELDDVFSESESLDTSDIPTQTIEGDGSGQGIPKTSTPAKKNVAGIDSPRMQGTPNPEVGGAKGGAKDGVTCGRYSGQAAPTSPTPAASSPHQVYQVPEPVAEISVIGVGSSSAGDLRNPYIIPRSEAIPIPTDAASLGQLELSSVLDSLTRTTEGHEKLSKGYHSNCVRSNIRHARSVGDMRLLSDSFSSQQDQIEALETSVAALQEEMRKMKARYHHNQQKTSTHLIPYDSLKDEQTSYILPTDNNLRAELFLLGFGSGHGTHLSLKVTGDLPTRCHFEARVVNSSDDEETRKKSTDSKVASGAHIVEFPKLIEKDVVENEALGYKRKGMLNITLIVSWDEDIDP